MADWEKQDQGAGIPRVSVIIPTCNGGGRLERLLAGLERQSRPPDEILLVDSSPGAETPAPARRPGVRTIRIAPEKFDHGGTRTMAARQAEGDILVFMTQDALPAGPQALARLLQPFADRRIAAAYGRQLPEADATVFAEHLRLFNYPARSAVRCWQDRRTLGIRTVFISNSFAAYRKQPLAEQGFFPDKLLFGEDSCALAKLLEHGNCVAYVSDACVYHSHNYSVAEDFRRYFDIGVFHAGQSWMLARFGTPTGAGKRYVRSEISLLIRRKKYRLLPESMLRNLAKFAAYNLGKRYTLLPRRLSMRLSMNRRWWMNSGS